jgi:arabinogalactan oligomer/maltooligosaccharide transport system substrate-binding protein
MFAGCGDSSSNDTADNTQGTSTATENEDIDYGSGTITIWAADAMVDYTKEKAEEYLASDEKYSGYTVKVEAVGEDQAATNMITDVEGGADIFSFSQDQLARLVAAGGLQPVTTQYADWIAENNDEGSVGAVQAGGMTYAFPETSDNTYFMYYDKSVISDPTSLEQILKDCEDNGKNFYFGLSNGWYQTAFFFGTGAELTYDVDDQGVINNCNCTYNSDAGLVALKEMVDMASSKAFQNADGVDDAVDMAAIITGVWQKESAQKKLGDNFAVAILPKFEGSDGQTYQMSGFGGYKMIGIKPQTEAGKLALCQELAQYLTDEDAQLARYELAGWGPSNKAAQNSDAIQADEVLSVVAAQSALMIPQGQYPQTYWDTASSLGDDIKSGKYTGASDDDLTAVLADFQATCEAAAQQ